MLFGHLFTIFFVHRFDKGDVEESVHVLLERKGLLPDSHWALARFAFLITVTYKWD